MKPLTQDRLNFLFSRTRFDDATGCMLWQGKLKKGYPWINNGKKRVLGHRLIWMALNGPIPSTVMICHHCDRPACLNPKHLFPGDSKANVTDMLNKGRAYWQQRRDSGPIGGVNSKLDQSTYDWVFKSAELGMTNRQIGSVVGLSRKTISEILNGRKFKFFYKLRQK